MQERKEAARRQDMSHLLQREMKRFPLLSGIHRAVEMQPLHTDRYMYDLAFQIATGQVDTVLFGALPGSGKSTILCQLQQVLHSVRPDLVIDEVTYSAMRAKAQEESSGTLNFAQERIQATKLTTDAFLTHLANTNGHVLLGEQVVVPLKDPITGEVLDRGLSTLDALVPSIKAGRAIVTLFAADPATMVVGAYTRSQGLSIGGDADMLLRLQYAAFQDSIERQQHESNQRRSRRKRMIRLQRGVKLIDVPSRETGKEIAQWMMELLEERGIHSWMDTVVWNPNSPVFSRRARSGKKRLCAPFFALFHQFAY